MSFTNGSLTSVGFGMAEPVSVCCPQVATGEGTEGTFTPKEGLAGIVVELVWGDPTFDLDLWLYGPDHETVFLPEINGTGISSSRGHSWHDHHGQTGAPEGHVALAIAQPEDLLAGEWSWGLSGKTGNAVGSTVAVSLFYGEAPAAGYAILGAA